jgi:naphthalene 1,2-dioxygenase ferredoxin component
LTALGDRPNLSNGGKWVRVAALEDITAAGVKGIEVQGYELALYHINGSIHCTSNVCTHAYALLSDGFLEGIEIECPLHAGRFDILTGKALCPPVTEQLDVYQVKVSGSDIFVYLPEKVD